jgi:hypothetical protein
MKEKELIGETPENHQLPLEVAHFRALIAG